MNEALENHKNLAEWILRDKLEEIQRCIKDVNMDIKLKQEVLKKHNKHLKDIVEALYVLESEKPNVTKVYGVQR